MTKYFARIDGSQCGPYTLEELLEAGVSPETYVWCKGMDNWKKAREVADICRAYRQRITSLLHPSLNEDNAEEEKSSMPDFSEIPLRFRRYVEKSGGIPGKPFQPERDLTRQPPSYLPWAILVTLFCSPITGMLAIFFAARCLNAWKKKEPEEAYELSRLAKMWTLISFFMGFLMLALVMQTMK